MVIITAKALYKSGQFIRCFELLQKQFMENPSYPILLFLYGKYVIKALALEIKQARLLRNENEFA